MLTRRHIRIKVMQSVYSFSIGKQYKIDDEVKFFKESIEHTFNLYLLLLSLIKSLHAYAEQQLETIQKHNIQNETHFIILQKFAQNKVLIFIKEHESLSKHLNNKKLINWDLEFKYLKELFELVTSSAIFKAYMALENIKIADDLKLVLKIFKDHIATSSYLYDHIEDQRLTWIDDLPMVNTFMLKMLKKIKVNKSQSLTFPKPSENQEDTDFGIQLLEKVIVNDEKLQKELLGKHQTGIKIELRNLIMLF